MPKKYFLITYGCQMNLSDSDRIAAFFEKQKFKKASKKDEADFIIVNMCSVRQSAVDRVYGLIPQFQKIKSKNPNLKTLLTGCILHKDREKFQEFFDYILPIKTLSLWEKILKKEKYIWENWDLNTFKCEYLSKPLGFTTYPIGYVPISTGCNNFCSYCVIPFTRGREICRPVPEIICEIEDLIKRGYKEIWLLGQNVNSYKANLKSQISNLKSEYQMSNLIDFPKLLRLINDIPGKFWIRFTSPHPKDFSDELIEAMIECEKVTPYLNLPVQSGDNEILKKMKRSYTREQYIALVKKIRQKIPHLTLSTDIIVGFPGETKRAFENTKKLMIDVKFDMAYIAQYSPRAGTLAASKMKDDVSKEEKREREKILTEILKKTAFEKNKRFVGKIVEVLPISQKNGFLLGKSFHYKTVKFKGEKDLIGKFQKVKIKQALSWGLEGELVKK